MYLLKAPGESTPIETLEPQDIRLKRFPFPLTSDGVSSTSVNNQYIAIDYVNLFETGEMPGASVIEEYRMQPVVCAGSGEFDLTFSGMIGAIGYLLDINRKSTDEAIGTLDVDQFLGSTPTLSASYQVEQAGKIFHPIVEPLRSVEFSGQTPEAGIPATIGVSNNPSDKAFMVINNRNADHKLVLTQTNAVVKIYPIFKSIQLVTELQDAFFSNSAPSFLLNYKKILSLY